MGSIRNNALTFIGNFVMAYFIFGEGTIGKPLIFAFWMLMLMMWMDCYKRRGSHTLN